MAISRWAKGPFELLVQAELHYRATTEQDRRLACILFDNAVEVCIVTYVYLDASQRGGRRITVQARENACRGFHSLLDFYYQDCTVCKRQAVGAHGDFVHFHRMRNEQYHGGTLTTPNREDVTDLRKAALDLFASLFEVSDVEEELDARVSQLAPKSPHPRSQIYDYLIDQEYGYAFVGTYDYEASEVLYNLDPVAYDAVGEELVQARREAISAEVKEGDLTVEDRELLEKLEQAIASDTALGAG